MSNRPSSRLRIVARPLWKFFAASIRSNIARGNGAPVSTCAVICSSTLHSQQKFSINWLGSSTASHSTPWMPETPATSTRVSSWCRPWPNSWKSVITSSCVNVAGRPVGRCRQVADEECDRMLEVRARTAAIDGVVLPRAALLAWPRVVVEVELADQRARRVVDIEETHVLLPLRRPALADRDAIERLRHVEEPGEHLVLRKVAANFLVGERKALRLELLRGVGEVPRRELGESEVGPGERLELRVVAQGVRPGAAHEVAQEAEHFVDARRHVRRQRDFGKVRVAEQQRCFVAQLEEAPDHRTVVPCRRRAEVRRARRIGAMQRGAQRAVVGVAQHRQIARHVQREFPAGIAIGFGRGARVGEHGIGHACQLVPVGDVERPIVGRIEHVVVESRRQLGQLIVDGLEARLFARGQLGAAQPEVAQFIGHGPSFRRIEPDERWRCGEFPVTVKQPEILRQVGVECGDLGQIGVVGPAPFGCARDGIEMSDHAPRAIESIEWLCQRLGHVVPGCRTGIQDDGVHRGTRVADQAVDCGRYVPDADRVKAGRARKIEQRVDVVGSVHRGKGVTGDGPRSKTWSVPYRNAASSCARSSGVPTFAQKPSKVSPETRPSAIHRWR